jgi:hypothetical protein
MESLLNSTMELETIQYGFTTKSVPKTAQKLRDGNFMKCYTNCLTKNTKFKLFTKISMFLIEILFL